MMSGHTAAANMPLAPGVTRVQARRRGDNSGHAVTLNGMSAREKIIELLTDEHSVRQRDRIVNYVGNDADRFAALMDIFFSSEYRLSQRAAWPMSDIAIKRPNLIQPYVGRLVRELDNYSKHVAVTRNILRTLQHVTIPERWHGPLMQFCFRVVELPDKPPALKAFSLTILANFTTLYPDIAAELRLLINERWQSESPAFRARGRHILSSLKS